MATMKHTPDTSTLDVHNDFNIPAAAKVVHVRLVAKFSTVGQYYAVALKPPGKTDQVAVRSQEAGYFSEQNGIVTLDENGKGECRSTIRPPRPFTSW